MTELDELISRIPIRHDLISYLVFSGVLMGFLLAIVIWVRTPRGKDLVFRWVQDKVQK